MDPRVVLLYGRSLLIAGLSASLAQSAKLRVVQASAWDEVDSLAKQCLPDALIYDLTAESESHILHLLFKNPGLLVIGVDPDDNRAVLLSGKETRSLTLERVKELVEFA